ncbi:MAG: shikimate dehydrogenase [Ilumatobacteraceae bacterium]
MNGPPPITGTTRLAAVIGHPVAHSLSPALHNAAFRAAGADWVYAAFDVAPGEAARALEAMRVLGLGGLSVTMPHKEDVAAAVDACTPAARSLASVNTVVRLPDGRLEGHSTDGDGFVASLREAGCEPAGRRFAVLGAGGAARAVIDALARERAAQIVVVNRTPARAEQAAALAGAVGSVGDPLDVADVDVIVNATSLGMGVGRGAGTDVSEVPLPTRLIRPAHVVVDLVYHPLETPLLAAARAAGAQAIDGLGMLVHQAALQQQLWRGELPDTTVMRTAALDELSARERLPVA